MIFHWTLVIYNYKAMEMEQYYFRMNSGNRALLGLVWLKMAAELMNEIHFWPNVEMGKEVSCLFVLKLLVRCKRRKGEIHFFGWSLCSPVRTNGRFIINKERQVAREEHYMAVAKR